jgi:hypothetical protein
MIQSCILLLLREKQNAAITVGVLQGIPGVITPMYAIPKNNIPKENQNAFLNLFMIDPFEYLFFNLRKT